MHILGDTTASNTSTIPTTQSCLRDCQGCNLGSCPYCMLYKLLINFFYTKPFSVWRCTNKMKRWPFYDPLKYSRSSCLLRLVFIHIFSLCFLLALYLFICLSLLRMLGSPATESFSTIQFSILSFPIFLHISIALISSLRLESSDANLLLPIFKLLCLLPAYLFFLLIATLLKFF